MIYLVYVFAFETESDGRLPFEAEIELGAQATCSFEFAVARAHSTHGETLHQRLFLCHSPACQSSKCCLDPSLRGISDASTNRGRRRRDCMLLLDLYPWFL